MISVNWTCFNSTIKMGKDGIWNNNNNNKMDFISSKNMHIFVPAFNKLMLN